MFPTILKRLPLHLTKGAKKNIGFALYSSNIVRSRFPDLVFPNVTVPELVFSNFSKHPNKIAMECAETGRKYTFEEVRRKSFNLNKALRKVLKLKRSDIVAVILPNVPEYPICILGSLLANLKVTTVNPAGTVEEMKRQILDADAKVIFTTCLLENHIKLVVQKLPVPVPVIAIKTNITDSIPEGFINFSEFVDTKFDIDDQYPDDLNDIAVIPYSSGTTGTQKGVLHSHNSIVSFVHQISSSDLDIIIPTTNSYQEVLPIILPFFHIYGLAVLLISQLYVLCKQVTISKFVPDLFLNVLETHKPRILCLVPPLVLFLTNSSSVTEKHLQSLQHILSGAAPLGESDEERLVKKSGGKLHVNQGYGLTEAPVTMVYWNDKEKLSPGAVGSPLQNTEVKVVPITNVYAEPLGPYEEGEILIRGPQVMKGYYNRPKETADTLIDGWLRTGDLGYYDKYQNFHIKDRLKELIKVKGYQVAPAELEEVIRGYPNVLDAVVIGIPHDRYGEVPRAYITVKEKTRVDLNELEQFVANNVSKHKQIQGGFSIVDSIPKTASGKYLRRNLKMEYLNNNL